MSKRTRTIDPYYLSINSTVLDHVCRELGSYAGHNWAVPDDLTSLAAIVGVDKVAELDAITDSAEKNIHLHSMLSNALRDKNHATRFAAIEWVVYDWGHVRRATSDKHHAWPKELGSYAKATVDSFIASNYQDRIASWSKVLAFADASKYAIYDARVAMTLNAMLDELDFFHRFYMPPPSSKKLQKVFSDIKQSVAAKNPDEKPKYMGYFDYMELLHAIVARGAAKSVLEVEMKLFANAKVYANKYAKKYDLKIPFEKEEDLE